MAKIQILNHTADYCVAIKAESLEDLLTGGLEAVTGYCAPDKPSVLTDQKKYRIEIEDDNLEDFFVRFLNEILFIMEDNGVIIYNIFYEHLSLCKLKAYVTAVGKENIVLSGEIKSATYHNLKVENKGDYIEATVLFDV